MRYKTKRGKTLGLFGKSKDETKLRVAVGMRLPLSVYKKLEDFQEKCVPSGCEPPSMSQIYIDLLEGAVDAIQSNDPQNTVIEAIPQFSAYAWMHRSVEAQNEFQKKRQQEIKGQHIS